MKEFLAGACRLNKRYPETEILKFGPSSNGMLENCARRGTDLELILDKRVLSRDIPSPVAGEALELVCKYVGASRSEGEAL